MKHWSVNSPTLCVHPQNVNVKLKLMFQTVAFALTMLSKSNVWTTFRTILTRCSRLELESYLVSYAEQFASVHIHWFINHWSRVKKKKRWTKKMVNDVYAFTYFVSTKNKRMLSGCFSHFSFPFDFSLFKRTVHMPVEEWRNSFEFDGAFFAKPAARVFFYSTPHTLRCVLHRFACATI